MAQQDTLSIDRDLPYIPEIAKGFRERLLCEACEQRLQRHENYFSKVWLDVPLLPPSFPGGIDELSLSGLDYAAFMAFHLSIVWRASVASHPAFRGARLGEHQELSRTLLLEENVEAFKGFRLYGNIVLRPGTRDVGISAMSPPEAILEGARIVANGALYAGVHWMLISPTDEEFLEDGYGLRPDGSLRLRIFDMRQLLPGFCDFIAEQRDRAVEARDRLRRRHPPRK